MLMERWCETDLDVFGPLDVTAGIFFPRKFVYFTLINFLHIDVINSWFVKP
ncbi:hypothetical protein HanPSC8_Chr16g0697521 [Helianthus annuus]|nr:hypothetical protein HanPSC8_Chr16g0697521 [Helianthus annuus]